MMRLPTSTFVLVFSLPLIGLAGCSDSDSSDGGEGPTGSLTAFSSYCTGTLLVDMGLMKADGAASWVGDGSLSAPAGTTILVGVGFDRWHGYVIQADGTPTKVNADFSAGLVKDTEFSSACATDDKRSSSAADHKVLLDESTFFATQDLSGAPCTLPAGTELTSFMFIGGNVATVASNEIEAQCGLQSSYSADIVYASLIDK